MKKIQKFYNISRRFQDGKDFPCDGIRHRRHQDRHLPRYQRRQTDRIHPRQQSGSWPRRSSAGTGGSREKTACRYRLTRRWRLRLFSLLIIHHHEILTHYQFTQYHPNVKLRSTEMKRICICGNKFCNIDWQGVISIL